MIRCLSKIMLILIFCSFLVLPVFADDESESNNLIETINYLKSHTTNESISNAIVYMLEQSTDEEQMSYLCGNANLYSVQDFFASVLMCVNVDGYCIKSEMDDISEIYSKKKYDDPRNHLTYHLVTIIPEFQEYYKITLPIIKDKMSKIAYETTCVLYANIIENYYEHWDDDLVNSNLAISPSGNYTYDCYQAYTCGKYAGIDVGFVTVYNNKEMFNYHPSRNDLKLIHWKNDKENEIYAFDYCVEGFMEGFEQGKVDAYYQQSLQNDIENQKLLNKIYENTNQITSDVSEIKGIRQESLDLQYQQYHLQIAKLCVGIVGWFT